MIAGRSVGSEARCHTAPLRLLSGVLFGAPALGAARAALRAWAEHTALGGGTGNPVPAGILARATIATDAAALLLERAARVADAPRASPSSSCATRRTARTPSSSWSTSSNGCCAPPGAPPSWPGTPPADLARHPRPGRPCRPALRPAGAGYRTRLLADAALPGPR